MFITDKLIFVELHKTGGSHILNLLEKITNGYRNGKKNRVPPEFRDRFIIGSVRNPWDWYVSLWAYGCTRQGSVYHQLTRGVDLKYNYRQLPCEIGKNRLTPREWWLQTMNDRMKPKSKLAWLYRDSNDPGHFREWIKLLMDPDRKLDIDEGFGFSPIARHYGLMTYRYLKLSGKNITGEDRQLIMAGQNNKSNTSERGETASTMIMKHGNWCMTGNVS